VSYLRTIEEKIILANSTFIYNIILNEGDYLNSIQVLQTLSSIVNEQSLSDKIGLTLYENETTKFPQIYGPLSNYTGVSPVSIYEKKCGFILFF
jgi:hypothetical protein